MGNMNPGGNPTTGSGQVANRSQQPSAGAHRPYLGGSNYTTAMSPPASAAACASCGNSRRAEFVVRTPDGVTAYTIHYGRWVTGRNFGGENTELDGWLELGTVAVTGGTAGELFKTPAFEMFTDPIGCYVTALTGSATENFRFWYREIP